VTVWPTPDSMRSASEVSSAITLLAATSRGLQSRSPFSSSAVSLWATRSTSEKATVPCFF
jgi:hypothetical protein